MSPDYSAQVAGLPYEARLEWLRERCAEARARGFLHVRAAVELVGDGQVILLEAWKDMPDWAAAPEPQFFLQKVSA